MQVCRVCLATDRKMFPFDSGRIHSYEQITGSTFVPEDVLPKYSCWECGYYISKYVAFKSKAVTSQCILRDILDNGGLITETSIRGIDRDQYKLQSTLTRTDTVFLLIKEEDENHVEIEIDIKSEPDDHNFDTLNDHLSDDLIDDIPDYDKNLISYNMPSPKATRNKTEFYNECVNSNNLIKENDRKSPIQLSCARKVREYEVNVIKESTKSVKLNEERNDIQLCVKRKRKKDGSKVISKKSNEKEKKSQKVSNVSVKGKIKKLVKDKKVVPVMDKIDKNILIVTKLSLDEQIAEIENRKGNMNYRKSEHKCTSCFRGFIDVEKYNRHMEKHSESNGAFQCKLCKLRYVAQCKLNLHMKTHLHRISCLQCSFHTSTLSVAMKHQNHHKGKQHVCPHCNEIYTHGSTYLSHLRIKHPSNVICQYCGHSFVNERGLLIHKKCVHRFDQKPIPADGPQCARCDIRFACQDALDNHELVSHADERNISEEKERRKKERKCRSKPTYEPFPDGPKPCEQCQERLPDARAYFEHFRREHKDKNRTLFYAKKAPRYMCEVCGKMCQSTANLRDHQYLHSDTKHFKCDRCGRLFQLNAHLRLHRRHHCGTKLPYPCNLCGKVFSNQSNLQRHKVSHTGVRAFKCEMCEKTFTHLGNKKNHVEFVHKKRPWPKRNRGARRRPERQPETMQQNPCDETDLQQEWNGTS